MPASKIPEILSKNKAQLAETWIQEQLAAATMRPDLTTEQQLREESSKFLDLLEDATARDASLNVDSAHFAPLKEMLTGISASRSQQGFTPSETVTFIVSLRQPLISALRKAVSGDGLFEEIEKASKLVDHLGMLASDAYQASRESVISRQQADMMELSTPVVQLWEGILAVPLIGTLDSNRTNLVMENLLTEIVKTRSSIAIIDITGVPTVDTLVAQHLLKTVAATRLMGAECIISGIRPQIAQTMVHLQIDLSAVTTKATLAEALVVALRRVGYTFTRNTQPSGR